MSNVKKKIEVVMLPTEKSKIAINKILNCISHYNRLIEISTDYKPQHLYFVSSEPIKEGDWVADFRLDGRILVSKWTEDDNIDGFFFDPKVIIATTDESLTNEIIPTGFKSGVGAISHKYNKSLPSPSPQFIDKYIEEYNKGNVIKEVMVEYYMVAPQTNGTRTDGKIFDEIYLGSAHNTLPVLKVDKNNHITITRCKDSWNREEVKKLLEDCAINFGVKNIPKNNGTVLIKINEFINQNL